MKILCIWDKAENEVITKMIKHKSDIKNAKFMNRKPNKIIVTEKDMMEIGGILKLRHIVSYDGLIISPNSNKPLYDGRKKIL